MPPPGTTLLKNVGRKGGSVFTPWIEFSQLEPKDFPTKGKEFAAKFYANKDSKINPMVARLFISPPRAFIRSPRAIRCSSPILKSDGRAP
jgi:hypothetical protein